jgi:Domain of unknown function (DUF4394)
MSRTRTLRRGLALTAVLAVSATATAAAGADADPGGRTYDDRILYATTSQNTLIKFRADRPERLRDIVSISGLPAGVTLSGIDFRPATGDLYGVGSDSVVYRVNPRTGIAVAEGPAFSPALRGRWFGVDFNPVVDKIRVVSDAAQNLRLNVDEGTVLSADTDLNPAPTRVVGAAYLNSSFSATRPAATTLFVVDSATDMIYQQNPPNNGTLTMGKRLPFDLQDQAGFDIAGADNVGYVATRSRGSRGGAILYRVDPLTGKSRVAGKIGGGRRLVVTGLAAWQD